MGENGIGRVFALIRNDSEPDMLAVRRGYVPAQTRPYGYSVTRYGNKYLRIIDRSIARHEAGLRRLELAGEVIECFLG